MGLLDFISEAITGVGAKSARNTYTYSKKAAFKNWHEAVGISISDEFVATVCERRGYGIMVSFKHNGKEYKGLVHNKNMSTDEIKDSTDLFSDREKVWVVVLGFDEKERIILKLKDPKNGKALATDLKIEIGTKCNCTVKDIRDRYIAVDIEGHEGITGYISIQDMSDTFVEHPSYMFKEGEHISAITVSHTEKGKVQLSFKKTQDASIYQVGQDINVRLVNNDTEHQKLTVVTQDENKMLANIPYKEISWTNDTSLQGQQYFKVRIKRIDTDNNQYKLTCSIRDLEENPWEKAIFAKGQEIPVVIKSYTEKGITIVTDDKYSLPGIIYKDQVTWLKNENEVTEEDYPKQNSKIAVSVLIFAPERQFLSCSIREQQENPWRHINIGDTVQGYVEVKSDSNVVRLENGIECECHDKIEFEPYKRYKFIVTDIDILQKKVEASAQLLQRADTYAQKASEFFKRRSAPLHTINWEDGQTTCVLLPQNILFKGEPIALPYIESCISFLEYNIPTHYREIMRSDKKSDIAFVSVDMTDTGFTMPTIDIAKIQRKKLCAKVIFETKQYFVINAVGVLGYLDKSIKLNVQDEIKVMLASEQDFPMQLYRFNIVNENEDNVENNPIEEFLTEEETKVISDEDLDLIQSLQKKIPTITKNNCHVFNEEVCLVYDRALEAQIDHFLKKEGDLSQQNFWLSVRIDKRTGKQTVAIFNSNDSILLCNASNDSFFIKEIYCSKEKSHAQKILNEYSQGTNLVLPGAKLRICKCLSTNNFDFEHLNNVLSQQYTVVAIVLPELSSKVRNRKEEIGQEYLVMSNFLQFQKNKEERRLQDLELSFDPNAAHLGTFESHACLVLNNEECSKFFAENKDKQEVKLVPYGTEKTIPGTLAKDDENYSVYFKSEQELSTFSHEGFTLTPAANVYHLKIQDASVKEFVFNNPLLDKLNDGTLCPPKTEDNIEFLNPIFNQVEEGNNQPTAIRKAVGNQDIFLIQGPPGTGKTSVIVEIIRQLVKKGEHVLVCSQAHSAVKNIYDRLLDADDSIRVGFLDDEKTMRAMSFKDHRNFLKRNILMLDALQKEGGETAGMNTSYDDYPDYLQEFYQRKHQQLREDALSQLDTCSSMIEIADDFLKDIANSNDEGDNRFYMASHVHSMQVVMGTCIGIGTNSTIKKSGRKFDTLIVDEAGKANMAETNVPMSLAKKYILVGDHNQLPPYMDIQEVEEFRNSDEAKEIDEAKIKASLSTSLFEDFLNDPSFPEESKALLNYQYRMNRTIGKMISELFYEGKLHNGTGTEKQTCELESFPDFVTFYDTGKTKSIKDYNPYEQNTGNGSIYNQCEIDIICDKIVPKIESLLIKDSNLSVGIVAPYSEQVRQLKKRLRGSTFHLENCVYTIDNIQGQEYDVVVLSFVRSFREKNRTVGFLDDLRRLNVALSRAKKKLIMVGNLKTLCRPDAHRPNGLGGKLPKEVFASLRKVTVRYAEYNNIDKLKQHGIRPGHIFENCPITIEKESKNQLKCWFTLKLDGKGGKEEPLTFGFPPYPYGGKLLQDDECFDFKYKEENSQDSDRPLFEIVPQKVEARVIECQDIRGTIELSDSSVQKVVFDNRNYILKQMLSGEAKQLEIPLVLKGHSAALDTEELQQRVNNLSGNRFDVQIVGEDAKVYWVWCASEKVIGFIVKYPGLPPLHVGDTLNCSVYKKNKESITFNYLRNIR